MPKSRAIIFIIVAVVVSVIVGWFTYPRTEVSSILTGNIGEGDEVSFTVIADDYYAGYERNTLVTAPTVDEWKTLWDRLHADVTPKPARPIVDFSEHMVVGVFQGLANGTKDSNLRVERVVDTKTTRVVSVIFEEPELVCTTGHSRFLGRPYQILTVPRSTSTLRMHKETRTIPCPE